MFGDHSIQLISPVIKRINQKLKQDALIKIEISTHICSGAVTHKQKF